MTKVQNEPENLPLALYLDEDEDDVPPRPVLKCDKEVKLGLKISLIIN